MVRLSERLQIPRAAEPSSSGAIESPGITSAHASEINDLAARLRREVPPGQLPCEEQAVSRLLYERLGAADIAAAEQFLRESPDFQALAPDTADPALKRRLILHAAMWRQPESAGESTGLVAAQPPDDVHAMARGPLAAAGGLYEADLVADAFTSAGVEVGESSRGLDFGCSSGRVVRVLAAAFPTVQWLGCDPNRPAIAWAAEHLSGIDFFSSGNEPPVSLEAGSLDLVFAISIWSHFEPSLGLRWFEEMHRLLRPGGHLMMTTHGVTSVAHYAGNGLRTPAQCAEIAEALYRRDWWYAPEFGATGDWGVVNPAWGTTFLTSEWVLTNLCPGWQVALFSPGRNASNQDVYVLQRS